MKLRYKLAIIVLAVAIITVPLAAIASWSPERPVKEYYKGVPGFDKVVFNSFTKTPNYGDERVFFDAKDATNTAQGGFADKMTVKPGQEILLRTYLHNNADSSLNQSGQGVAKNTKVRVFVPGASAVNLRAISFITADNATPQSVSDTAEFVGEGNQPVTMEYVAGSATAYTNAAPKGYHVSDDIASGGALVGYNGPDGIIPGCFEYDAVVTVKVKVKGSGIGISKQIAVPGQAWTEEVSSKPGETLSYLINFKNEGSTEAKNMVVRDILPQHLDIVPDSVKLYNSNFPDGKQMPNDALFTTGGINAGNYNAGVGGYFKFKVKLKDDFKDGKTTVTNVACVKDDAHLQETCDDAKFNVNKVGPTTVTPTQPGGEQGQPTSLPTTGVEAPLAGMAGTGVIGYSIHAYRKSRRQLEGALRNWKK